jgi:hypothetical protein
LAEVRDSLKTAQLFWVTTVRRDGTSAHDPLVAVWLDDALLLLHRASEQKAVNLRDNQEVILSTGCNQWDAGTRRSCRGNARRVTDTATLER